MNNILEWKRIESEGDFEAFSRLVFNEQVIQMDMGRAFTPEEAEDYFAFLLRYNRENPDSGMYMVFDGGTFLGVGALFVRPEGAEMEYMLQPEYWNRGYATKIVGELLRIARKIPELHQIRAMMAPQNAASKRVLIKNGFAYEKTVHIDEDDSDAEVYRLHYRVSARTEDSGGRF